METPINCPYGSIEFYFSEAMNISVADPIPNATWNITDTYWEDNDSKLIMVWNNDSSYCNYDSPPQITFTLSGYRDKAGKILTGDTSFTFVSENISW